MASIPVADYRLNRHALIAYLRFFKVLSGGSFSATLVKENGQGYNLVLHRGDSTPKVRIAFAPDSSRSGSMVGSSWEVRDILEQEFAEGGHFLEATEQVVDRALVQGLGCLRLVMDKGRLVAVHFHDGELWP